MTNDARRVIVIGSGPVGAMAAHELVRRKIPVLMLESGSRLPKGFLLRVAGKNLCRYAPPSETGKRHISTGDPETEWHVMMEPGGLSNQWTGAVPRFAPEDFTEGERLHERYRWPLTYDELDDYYTATERLMGITADAGPAINMPTGYADYKTSLPDDWMAIARSIAAKGQSLTSMPLADGPRWLLSAQGTFFNSYSVIVRNLMNSPNFEFRTGVHALQLEWSAEKDRVDSVLCHVRADNNQQRFSADAVIVACGSLHSTKLLFDSACPSFPDGLGNTEGLLGNYLHDHPRDWWRFDTEKALTQLSPTAYMTRLPYAQSQPLLAASWTICPPTALDKIKGRLAIKTHEFGVQVFGTMIPNEKNYVQPTADKKDEFGLPALEIKLRYDAEAMQNLIASRQVLIDRLQEAGYVAKVRDAELDLETGSSVHYGGTVRMHESRKYGMLDTWNRLYDVPNVLVCDASCFTTGAEKNPTLTAMALGARAADRLADDLRQGNITAAHATNSISV